VQELQHHVAKSDAEVERLRGVEAYLKQQLAAMEGAINAKNAEIESIQKELENNKTTYEEKVVYLQMQMTAAKNREDQGGKDAAAHKATVDKLTAQIAALQRTIEEKDLSYKSNKDMIQALQTRIIELEPELASSRDKIAQLERNGSAQV
jgi:chromosome segregation ATPase